MPSWARATPGARPGKSNVRISNRESHRGNRRGCTVAPPCAQWERRETDQLDRRTHLSGTKPMVPGKPEISLKKVSKGRDMPFPDRPPCPPARGGGHSNRIRLGGGCPAVTGNQWGRTLRRHRSPSEFPLPGAGGTGGRSTDHRAQKTQASRGRLAWVWCHGRTSAGHLQRGAPAADWGPAMQLCAHGACIASAAGACAPLPQSGTARTGIVSHTLDFLHSTGHPFA